VSGRGCRLQTAHLEARRLNWLARNPAIPPRYESRKDGNPDYFNPLHTNVTRCSILQSRRCTRRGSSHILSSKSRLVGYPSEIYELSYFATGSHSFFSVFLLNHSSPQRLRLHTLMTSPWVSLIDISLRVLPSSSASARYPHLSFKWKSVRRYCHVFKPIPFDGTVVRHPGIGRLESNLVFRAGRTKFRRGRQNLEGEGTVGDEASKSGPQAGWGDVLPFDFRSAGSSTTHDLCREW
jgi:hypothetical protein